MSTPIVSIIGRPNVGKSTIFNRILGNSYKAITYNEPGVTRDRHYGIFKIDDEKNSDIILVDTGGFYPEAKINIKDEMHGVLARQAELAIKESDLVLIVVDVREGLLPFDELIVQYTRKQKKDFWVIVNKHDSDKQIGDEAEFYSFGDHKYFITSAEHNRGLSDLRESLVAFQSEFQKGGDLREKELGIRPNFKLGGKIAIVGAPNVGKSTLLNRLIGAERAVVSNIAGTTVDPIEGFIDIDFDQEIKHFEKDVFHFRKNDIASWLAQEFGDDELEEDNSEEELREEVEELVQEEVEEVVYEDTWRSLQIVDTAGIRRKSNIDGFIESQSVFRSLRSISEADVILYLVDGEIGLTHQDKKLISIAIDKGKSVLICINKIDLKPEVYADRREKKEFLLDFDYEMNWLSYCKPVFISAKEGKGIKSLFRGLKNTLLTRKKTIATGELNRHLHELFDSNPVLVRGGSKGPRELKLKYGAMVKGTPPTFLLFTNRSMNIPRNFRRYMVNGIRKRFPMPNTPIHLIFRAGRNAR